MNFESGTFFDIYKVGEKLGHGHFAEVKHCVDKKTNTEYAAKFIRVRQLLDSKSIGMSIEEIEREADILKMLNHQNIIKLFFCHHLGKTIALVLELVAGGELFDHISDSEKLSEEEASEFIEQILYGVQHMHEKKVVHLDLKPENVMIEDLEERKIKLIDFGLAREIKKQDTIIEMQGTAEFLAPEVINYEAISYATDMWAIGVITYIMLTGVSPFSGDDQSSTFQNIVTCKLDFEEDVCSDMSEMAKSFINSLLVLDPKKRATANFCLKHRWIKPMEQASVFRRRSSIISRDKLQSLKQFVVYPSPPSSGSTTPIFLRKHKQIDDLNENLENAYNCLGNNDDLLLLNSTVKFPSSHVEENLDKLLKDNNLDNNSHLKSCDNELGNLKTKNDNNKIENFHEKTNSDNSGFELNIPIISDEQVRNTSSSSEILIENSNNINSHKYPMKIGECSKYSQNDIQTTTCTNGNPKLIEQNSKYLTNDNEKETLAKNREVSDFEENFIENPSNSMDPINLNGETNHPNNSDIISNEPKLKQKINNSILNSVKKLNSKFESITSLFDSKSKSNSSSLNLNSKRRGSLKNTLNINTGNFMFNSTEKTKLFTGLTAERSTSYDETVKFKSKPASASVATSPTILKKSIFVSRYMAHIENKKN